MINRFQAPLARLDQLVIEEAGDELLVYDQRSDQAHCLGSTAASVWRACDGDAGIKQISAKLGLDRQTVTRAIEELEDCALLDGQKAGGITRREATSRLAKLGGAAVVAPLIYSIVAPSPALAVSNAFCQAGGCRTACGGCPTGCHCCGPANNGLFLCVASCTGAPTTGDCTAATLKNACGGNGATPTCT